MTQLFPTSGGESRAPPAAVQAQVRADLRRPEALHLTSRAHLVQLHGGFLKPGRKHRHHAQGRTRRKQKQYICVCIWMINMTHSFSSKEDRTTETEEAAMAAEPIQGCSTRPTGMNTPAQRRRVQSKNLKFKSQSLKWSFSCGFKIKAFGCYFVEQSKHQHHMGKFEVFTYVTNYLSSHKQRKTIKYGEKIELETFQRKFWLFVKVFLLWISSS